MENIVGCDEKVLEFEEKESKRRKTPRPVPESLSLSEAALANKHSAKRKPSSSKTSKPSKELRTVVANCDYHLLHGAKTLQSPLNGNLRRTGTLWTGTLWTGILWTGILWTGIPWTGILWTGTLWTAMLTIPVRLVLFLQRPNILSQ